MNSRKNRDGDGRFSDGHPRDGRLADGRLYDGHRVDGQLGHGRHNDGLGDGFHDFGRRVENWTGAGQIGAGRLGDGHRKGDGRLGGGRKGDSRNDDGGSGSSRLRTKSLSTGQLRYCKVDVPPPMGVFIKILPREIVAKFAGANHVVRIFINVPLDLTKQIQK